MTIANEVGVDTARVLVVDALAMCRQSLVMSLSGCENLSVVADVGTIDDAKLVIADNKIDVVVVNASLADGSGIDLARQLKMTQPYIKVVLMTAQADEQCFIEAVKANVDGYVLKSSPYPRFLGIIKSVLNGNCAYDWDVAGDVTKRIIQGECGCDEPADPLDAFSSLSIRERQVVELLAKGLTNKEIANQLAISLSTTKTHISRIFRRLGISCRRELLPKLQIMNRRGYPFP